MPEGFQKLTIELHLELFFLATEIMNAFLYPRSKIKIRDSSEPTVSLRTLKSYLTTSTYYSTTFLYISAHGVSKLVR
jgi:hypothetical protein